MKKFLLLILLMGLFSCGLKTNSENIQCLQKLYPNAVIYDINNNNHYIIIDSIKVYDIRVRTDGSILSTVKVK